MCQVHGETIAVGAFRHDEHFAKPRYAGHEADAVAALVQFPRHNLTGDQALHFEVGRFGHFLGDAFVPVGSLQFVCHLLFVHALRDARVWGWLPFEASRALRAL